MTTTASDELARILLIYKLKSAGVSLARAVVAATRAQDSDALDVALTTFDADVDKAFKAASDE